MTVEQAGELMTAAAAIVAPLFTVALSWIVATELGTYLIARVSDATR